MSIEEKITVENVNVPGYSSQVSKVMYDAMLRAMWKAIPAQAPGLTESEIRKAVLPFLPQDLYPGGARAGWWVNAVQLDQEAKGSLVREATTPLRWHRLSRL